MYKEIRAIEATSHCNNHTFTFFLSFLIAEFNSGSHGKKFSCKLVRVQSDWTVRKKFSYGRDLNATSESFIYNFDMQSFYRKTIYDQVDAINDSSFVDTAPYTGIEYFGISCESAMIVTQYCLCRYQT